MCCLPFELLGRGNLADILLALHPPPQSGATKLVQVNTNDKLLRSERCFARDIGAPCFDGEMVCLRDVPLLGGGTGMALSATSPRETGRGIRDIHANCR